MSSCSKEKQRWVSDLISLDFQFPSYQGPTLHSDVSSPHLSFWLLSTLCVRSTFRNVELQVRYRRSRVCSTGLSS